jgi:type II secretion system protein D
MTVIETVINDLETNPGISGNVRSFHLKYADATGTAKVLTNIFTDAQAHQTGTAAQREKVTATADLRTNTVVVNGGPESLRTVEKIIQDLDASPTAGSEVQYFHLKSADATVTAKLLMGFFRPADGQPARPEDKYAHAGVNAAADERTNTVIVTAPPEAMIVVQKMVQELESDPSIHFDIRSYSLQFADAPTTAKLITTLYTPDPQAAANPLSNHPLGQELAVHARVIASSDDRTNTLVVTAPQETLKVIDNLVKLLDASPSASKNMRVYQLQYADASAAVKLIQSVYPTQPPVSTSGAAPKTPLSAEEIHRNLAINAAADDRTNTLVVNAPPDVLQVIDGIVKQLDSNPSSEETFFIYRLKNAQAVNLEIVLNQMFGNYSQPGQGGQGQRQPNQGAQAFGQFGLGALGRGGLGQGGGIGGQGRNAAFGNGSSNRSGFGGATGTFNRSFGSIPGLSNGLGLARTFNELTGEVLVIADPDTNSLLVTTASKYEKHVREIITELDHPVPQVLIKVLLAEVTHDNSADFGVDYSILNTRSNGLGQSFNQTFGNPGSGLIVNLVENKINATLHALATQGKLDVLSRPYILASDNQEASILVGQEVPLVTGTNVSALGQTFNNITYQDVGIILDVTPHINPDGLVTLDVAPTISQLTAQTVAVGPDTTAPVIAQRSAQSRVAIKDGQTIVIGGLMEDRKTETINKIPILGDIPVLRLAFSRTEITKTKTELLIFLTPHVAQQPETLKPMSQDELKGTKLTPRAVEPGVFDEHLRGMQRGNVPEAKPATRPSVRFRTNSESPATNPTDIAPAPTSAPAAEDTMPLPLN